MASEQVLEIVVRRHVLTGEQAQGSAGLMRFLQPDLDAALAHDPQT
jgi:hypothetical protein